LDFSLPWFFRPHYGSEVDWDCSRNK